MADFHLSVLSRAAGPGADDPALPDRLRDALRDSGQVERWKVNAEKSLWYSASPVDAELPKQGWKLHLSATPQSAPTVLERALPTLVTGNSAFKFARTTEQVAQLTARHTPRGHSGKFITVYPSSDDEAVRLAAALHTATAGLPGPRVLSDRPYLPGSLVHYRYGAFVEERRISNDGLYTWVIFDPDGNPVEDRRIGQYVPPSWARCPFPEPPVDRPSGGATSGGGVLLRERFLVREAIRHVNKGGVYRAVDTRTGEPAILKEARPHVAVDRAGRDVRDLLRAETRALERLAAEQIAPRVLALFEEGDHLFLAEELVPGVSLREWVLERIRAGGWRRSVPDALELADRLVALLAVAHRAGLVLRDFTPNNVIVRPDGDLRLIDLELAVPADADVSTDTDDDTVLPAGTPGYAAPEQLAGAPAARSADSYSLGASICFLFTGSTPDLLPEQPPTRPQRERLSQWLAVRTTPELPPQVPALVLDLMDPEPARRPTVTEAARVLVEARADRLAPRRTGLTAGGPTPTGVVPPEVEQGWDQTIDGIVEHLLSSMNPENPERLWPVSCTQGSPDPCIVQLGAAGVLGPLARHLSVTGDPRVADAVAMVGAWISRRAGSPEQRPPGLYFGQAGIAWALYDAGRVLEDDTLCTRGLELAAALPVSSPNPDVTHGTAGIGMALLHLGRSADQPELLRKAEESADVLVATATEDADGLIWGTPAAFDSRLAGGRFYGFAHGTAGIATFLLATGRDDCVDLARRAGETLLDHAVIDDGVAQWGPGPGDATTAPYWCHGASGIGTFLTRLHRVTGDDRFGKVAGLAAQAVMENSSRGVLGQCHGLAGNGEFLLDLAETHDQETHDQAGYRRLAGQLAQVVLASRAHRGHQVVFPNEEGGVSATWADGAGGILSFLVRLRHPFSRMWTVDPASGARA